MDKKLLRVWETVKPLVPQRNLKLNKMENEKWVLLPETHSEYSAIIQNLKGEVIAKVYGETKEQKMANAKMMVASQIMLKALESANNYFIDLQNKCALTNSDERAWKSVALAIQTATK